MHTRAQRVTAPTTAQCSPAPATLNRCERVDEVPKHAPTPQLDPLQPVHLPARLDMTPKFYRAAPLNASIDALSPSSYAYDAETPSWATLYTAPNSKRAPTPAKNTSPFFLGPP